MIAECIFLISGNKFSSAIFPWAQIKANEVIQVPEKLSDYFHRTDSLLIFNQNQELSNEIQEIKSFYDKQQKPVHKIDINGTLMVGKSNLALWMESNKSRRILVLGSDELCSNPNLERYMSAE